MMTTAPGLFCAEWRDLVMISYEVDPLLLVPLVPAGTSLDFHEGRAIVSVVGLRFMNTRIAGIPFPLHQDFEQVNFRFYVWRQVQAEIRPGVVFIKEIVPSTAMTLGARLLFNEQYDTAPMRHDVVAGEHGWASYEWQMANRWNRLSGRRNGRPQAAAGHGIETFVKDRHWSYARQRGGSTLEFRIEHPSWDISPAADATLDCDVARVYGPKFASTLGRPPLSAFIAVGSDTVLHPGHPID
jgi:uncharacterized protein YqjF (DUF2071 family)